MVKKNNVLDKKFYVVIPFSSLELGIAPTLTSLFKKNTSLPYEKGYIIPKAKIVLIPKRDHLIKLFARLSLVSKQLTSKELVKLFYGIYNPEMIAAEREAQKKAQNEN
jgi:hypothetical protein